MFVCFFLKKLELFLLKKHAYLERKKRIKISNNHLCMIKNENVLHEIIAIGVLMSVCMFITKRFAVSTADSVNVDDLVSVRAQ